MNHEKALSLSAAERYLLNDLDEDLHGQFEAHFFTCIDCATDIRAGAALLDQMKIELAREPATRLKAADGREPQRLFFLRPAWAAAIAAMLLVMGYQNLIQVPHLKSEMAALNAPEVMPTVSLMGGVSRADKLPSAYVEPGKRVLLTIDIPTDERYSSYEVSVMDSGAKPVWTMPITAQQAKDTIFIEVPGTKLHAGTYTLVIAGIASGAKPIAVEGQPFQIYSHN